MNSLVWRASGRKPDVSQEGIRAWGGKVRPGKAHTLAILSFPLCAYYRKITRLRGPCRRWNGQKPDNQNYFNWQKVSGTACSIYLSNGPSEGAFTERKLRRC